MGRAAGPLAVVDGSVALFSRNGADISRTFPKVTAALDDAAAHRRSVVLDGEIVALDPQVPVRFYLFDLLAVDGDDVRGLAYRLRRVLLDEVGLAGTTTRIQIPPFWVDVAADVMLDISRQHGLEGIVSKRLDSPYVAGRSPHWIKTQLRRSAEVVVGWVPGGGPNAHTVDSLLVGGHTPSGQLVPLGQVGTGFTAAERRGNRCTKRWTSVASR